MKKSNIVAMIAGGVFALFTLFACLGSFYTIDEGERGVVLRNGKVVEMANPGLGWKVPFIDSVKEVSVQTFTVGFGQLQAYSRDQQPATIRASVTFRVPADEVITLYTQFGDIERMRSRIIDRIVPNQVENIFGQYNAISVVQNRATFVQDINNAVKENVSGPVLVESVQIENIDFSDAYEQSVEARMLAEVEVQKVEQNEKREIVQARIVVLNAEAEADSRLAKAKADAEAIRLRGEAEAHAIRERAAALAQNENLVELVRAENWNGVLPTTVLPNNAVPFLNTGK